MMGVGKGEGESHVVVGKGEGESQVGVGKGRENVPSKWMLCFSQIFSTQTPSMRTTGSLALTMRRIPNDCMLIRIPYLIFHIRYLIVIRI